MQLPIQINHPIRFRASFFYKPVRVILPWREARASNTYIKRPREVSKKNIYRDAPPQATSAVQAERSRERLARARKACARKRKADTTNATASTSNSKPRAANSAHPGGSHAGKKPKAHLAAKGPMPSKRWLHKPKKVDYKKHAEKVHDAFSKVVPEQLKPDQKIFVDEIKRAGEQADARYLWPAYMKTMNTMARNSTPQAIYARRQRLGEHDRTAAMLREREREAAELEEEAQRRQEFDRSREAQALQAHLSEEERLIQQRRRGLFGGDPNRVIRTNSEMKRQVEQYDAGVKAETAREAREKEQARHEYYVLEGARREASILRHGEELRQERIEDLKRRAMAELERERQERAAAAQERAQLEEARRRQELRQQQQRQQEEAVQERRRREEEEERRAHERLAEREQQREEAQRREQLRQAGAGARTGPSTPTPSPSLPRNIDCFQLYDAKWDVLRGTTDAPDVRPLSLYFEQLPWPLTTTINHPSLITKQDVRNFVLHVDRTGWEGKSVKERIVAEVLRWHPDKFNATVIPMTLPEHQTAVSEGAGMVARILLELKEELCS